MSSSGTSASPGPQSRWEAPETGELQEMLPGYEVLGIIGRGGMGAVFRARQRSLDRIVAIKVLPSELAETDATFAERFKNEARLMARMSHPAIVAVHDHGETSKGQLYLVMEYVDGADVAQMIRERGKLPPDEALAITLEVCDALGYAHKHRVWHRDIKPANLLIQAEGRVKVADFGLARMDDASVSGGLTRTGLTMGTAEFIAPEAMILGEHVDGRADLYSLGVTLYQMLTGEVPRGLFLMPGLQSKGAIDLRFDHVISRAMQSDRARRYQTAAEMRADLQAIQAGPVAAAATAAEEAPKADRPVTSNRADSAPVWRKPGVILAMGVVALLGGVGAWVRNSNSNSKPGQNGTTAAAIAEAERGWVDGLAEWWKLPEGQRTNLGHLVKEERGSRVGKAAVYFGIDLKDVEVRATVVGGSAAEWSVNLRAFYGSYQAVFQKDKAMIRLIEFKEKGPGMPSTFSTLESFDLPAGFSPADRHTVEFRAEGEVLTLTLDGKVLGTARDSSRSIGNVSFQGEGALLETFEYRVLPVGGGKG